MSRNERLVPGPRGLDPSTPRPVPSNEFTVAVATGEEPAGEKPAAKARTPANDPRSLASGTEPTIGTKRQLPIPRAPTDDELAGIRWWNGLSKPERSYWLAQAGTDAQLSVARAWAEYKRQLCRRCRLVPAAGHLNVCVDCFESFWRARRSLYLWVRLGVLR